MQALIHSDATASDFTFEGSRIGVAVGCYDSNDPVA